MSPPNGSPDSAPKMEFFPMENGPRWDALAEDYARHRKGYPEVFYEQLETWGLLASGQRVADIGGGTGDVGRGLLARGIRVQVIDPAQELLRAGKSLEPEGAIAWLRARAEALPLAEKSQDLCVLASSFAWMDPIPTLAECKRILTPTGALVLAHFVWTPLAESVTEVTQNVLAEFTSWSQKSRGTLLPGWIKTLQPSPFRVQETFDQELSLPYGVEDWCGRIRASVPVRGRMDPETIEKFDEEHRRRLLGFAKGGALSVPHRVYGLIARPRS